MGGWSGEGDKVQRNGGMLAGCGWEPVDGQPSSLRLLPPLSLPMPAWFCPSVCSGAVKLFADFFDSDIVVASPLALATTLAGGWGSAVNCGLKADRLAA